MSRSGSAHAPPCARVPRAKTATGSRPMTETPPRTAMSGVRPCACEPRRWRVLCVVRPEPARAQEPWIVSACLGPVHANNRPWALARLDDMLLCARDQPSLAQQTLHFGGDIFVELRRVFGRDRENLIA